MYIWGFFGEDLSYFPKSYEVNFDEKITQICREKGFSSYPGISALQDPEMVLRSKSYLPI